MGSPVIFAGNYAKSLKANLNLNDQVYHLSGTADPSLVAQDAPQGSIYLRTGVSGGTIYVKQDSGLSTNWTTSNQNPGGGTGIKFTLSGGVSLFTCIDGPHRVGAAATLSNVSISMLDSGSSGSTTIQINQYRAGVLQASATASLASNSSLPNGALCALSASLSLANNDVLTVDVTAVANGAPSDLTVEIDGTNLAGPTGPTGVGAAPILTGSTGAPSSVTAAGGVSLTAPSYYNIAWIVSSGGAVTVTATPSVTSGTTTGQRLTLLGTSNVNTVTLRDEASLAGSKLQLNGNWTAQAYSALNLIWDGTYWVEESRR
jgi:hypothetical protein